MDPCELKPTISQAHPETMDFLSSAWCNFAVQAFQPELQDQSLILHDSSIKKLDNDTKPPFLVSYFGLPLLFLVLFSSLISFDRERIREAYLIKALCFSRNWTRA